MVFINFQNNLGSSFGNMNVQKNRPRHGGGFFGSLVELVLNHNALAGQTGFGLDLQRIGAVR